MLLCFCFLPCVLLWFLMIAYDCINLTHSPCGIWTMVENWHTTVMVTIQILWSALSIVVFFVSLFILLVSILNGMSTNRLQLFFFVVFIIIIIFLLGSGYIMKRRCWRPDKKYQPARNWGRGRCNLSNVPKWTMGDGVPSLLHIFQIKWEIQCDLSAVWNNVCVIVRFDV